MPTSLAPLDEIGLESFAPYLMNRIMGRYNESLQQEMLALGLTTAKMRALATLAVRDGLRIQDLAIYAVVQQSTLSRALDGLEADGLIARSPCPEDNRATLVHLCAEGRAAYDRLWPHMAESYARMFTGISPKERAAFTETLQKMLRNIRKHDI